VGHAPKVTAKAIISISGEASARMLSSQSMCASLRMERNECLHRECVIDTWIGVNLREGRWSLWKRNQLRAREVHTDDRCPALSLRHLCSRSTCALRWSLGRSLRSPYKQHPRTTFITVWSCSGRLPISRNQPRVSKHGEFMGTPIIFQMLGIIYIGEDRARLGLRSNPRQDDEEDAE